MLFTQQKSDHISVHNRNIISTGKRSLKNQISVRLELPCKQRFLYGKSFGVYIVVCVSGISRCQFVYVPWGT